MRLASRHDMMLFSSSLVTATNRSISATFSASSRVSSVTSPCSTSARSRRGEAEDLVAGLHHGVALGEHRGIAAEDRGDARVHRRDVLLEVAQRMADERAALESAHGDEAHLAVRELEHLQGLGKLDQLDDV